MGVVAIPVLQVMDDARSSLGTRVGNLSGRLQQAMRVRVLSANHGNGMGTPVRARVPYVRVSLCVYVGVCLLPTRTRVCL